MTELQEHPIDRSNWRPGPWDGEPNRVDWRHAGLPCFVLRNRLGAWCGYVGVPRGHALFGRPYDEVDVRVHGGLTYASRCAAPICHVPRPGESDEVWWFGFDCAHGGDRIPGMDAVMSAIQAFGNDTYRDLAYVKAETNELADQLKTARPETVRDHGMLQLARNDRLSWAPLRTFHPVAHRTRRKTKRLRRRVNQACRNFRGELFITDDRVDFKRYVTHVVMNEGGSEGRYARLWVQQWYRHAPTDLRWRKLFTSLMP